jgi:NAD(P)-dependent dehydrogenase (short-subunit alcohol dehydrogenase family)
MSGYRDFDGKVVLVTGGGTGMGAATAELLVPWLASRTTVAAAQTTVIPAIPGTRHDPRGHDHCMKGLRNTAG